MDSLTYPIVLSVIAGSATGLGGMIVYLLRKVEAKYLGFLMGFAGGVMLVVSFLELLAEAIDQIGIIWSVGFYCVGALLMMAIDLTLPHIEFGAWEKGIQNRALLNSGLAVALGMSLHNLPEGFVVSAGYSHDASLGLFVTVMIFLHNIPEGIATVTPLMSAGLSRRRAVGLTTLSGLTEPIGALLGGIVIRLFGESALIIGFGLAFAAGVMTNITIDELIPVAHTFCTPSQKHFVSSGVLCGVVFAQLLSLVF